ncbi:MAG: HAD-IC family P-type ATPase [Patescibacteria group bacterium]|nr:HAD-IC family P-type ATPase [Patescibacteria group bacterium]
MKFKGLSGKKAKELLKKHGENQLKAKRAVSWVKVLLDQFKSPLIYILVMASGVTLALGDFIDAGVIGAAVILNTILGFYQEMKAEKSLDALSKMLTPKAKVIRDGKRQMIEAKDVVPGDICVLEIGERVPADGKVIEADSLSINEAMLTGESVAVEKTLFSGSSTNSSPQRSGLKGVPSRTDLNSQGYSDKGMQVYMGTTISSGIGKMRVEKTGQETEIGKIAEKLTETKEEKTPLQKQINKFSKKLAIMVGVISLVILGAGLVAGDPFIEIFTTAVAVAVSAIPEGLAVSLTVILAIGMQRIFKKKALVRKLMAAETLGSVTVVCADKTGTLTEGKMKVVQALTSLNPDKKIQEMKAELMIKAAVLCNDMRDPLEIGMMDWAKSFSGSSTNSSPQNFNKETPSSFAVPTRHSAGFPFKESPLTSRTDLSLEALEKDNPRLDQIPFDPKWRYIATLHKGDKKNLLLVSGAPEEILSRCKTTKERRKKWEDRFVKEGKKGRRLVGFAFKEMSKKVSSTPESKQVPLRGETNRITDKDIKDLRWIGSLVYEDPVRSGVEKALKQAKRAGIKVKVITGDYRFTAEAIVNQLNLEKGGLKNSQIMEGLELAKISDEELKKKIEETVLFCRTKPEQKLRIVQALQDKGEVVAMTGDGVNDAPAVKKADIGIVVENASAVAKETADMILLDSNFETIVDAIEEGRGIFVNLKKIILYLLSDAFAEVILVLGSIFLGLPLPITAAQILWINLVDDGLPDFALTLEPKPNYLMKQKAEGHERELLDGEVKLLIGLISTVTGLLALGVFWWYLKITQDIVLARTLAFTLLGVDSLLYVFSCKTLKEPLWKEKLFNNMWLVGAVLIGLSFQVMALYVPGLQKVLKTVGLGFKEWLIVAVGGLLVMVMIEGIKFTYNRNEGRLRVK